MCVHTYSHVRLTDKCPVVCRHFVPNITFGAPMVKSLREKLPGVFFGESCSTKCVCVCVCVWRSLLLQHNATIFQGFHTAGSLDCTIMFPFD